jgi:diguanylate cyclase (GGDEF)-like protein/hemerythrin-like metal-binding protein
LAGILVAPAFLAMLAYRPLRDRTLSLTGLFGLGATGAWITHSGIAAACLPPSVFPWLHSVSLVFSALSLVAWERVTSRLLRTSAKARQMPPSRHFIAACALLIALLALAPWELTRRISEWLLGFMAPLMACLTFAAGLGAREDGVRPATSLLFATLALLVACASFWAVALGWMSSDAGMTLLQSALVALATALGWAMLSRMTELRHATEVAQAAQLAAAATQAQELEAQVAQRNAELSARLKDLEEARSSAETANQSLQLAMEQLEQVAATDRLTGAWNRRRFEESALSEIAQALRKGEDLSLIMFDLDHFKRVNDTFGHAAGDAVLVGTAQVVREQLRASDALVRWGGEEFLVMAPATPLEGAMGLAEKLRLTVAALDFPGVGQVTMSLGVAAYAMGERIEDWVDRADQALYRAKTEGRNRVLAADASKTSQGTSALGRSLLELVWEGDYASGHPIIDAQHKRLFHLASALLSAVTQERPLSEIAPRLETLLAHTAQHFHDEESLLRQARYPDLTDHARYHAALLTKARDLQKEVQSGNLDFGRLVTFLAMDLIREHFLSEDRNYFAHLLTALGPGSVPSAPN